MALSFIPPVTGVLLYTIVFAFPSSRAYNAFIPGIIIQIGIFSFPGIGRELALEMESETIERLRITPVKRIALLLGRQLHSVTTLLVQALLVITVSAPLGLTVHALGLCAALAMVGLVGLLMTSASCALALRLRNPDVFGALALLLTLLLVAFSGVLLPFRLLPAWLRHVAALNPLAYAVDASRATFNNDFSDPNVLIGFTAITALAAVALVIALRSFRAVID